MSSVVINNRNITKEQRIINIDQNKVLLPFYVSKEQLKKLEELLSKIKVTFLIEQDKFNISSLTYNNLNIKSNNRQLNNCNFSLSKTYVVTMKQSFISKVKIFYERLIEEKMPERPVFNIGNETNLQQALAEATVEIDLSTIKESLNNNPPLQNVKVEEQQTQVLANNPLGETIIENPVNLNNQEQPMNVNIPITPVEPTPATPVAPEVNAINQQPQIQPQENMNTTVPQQPIVTEQTVMNTASQVQQPAQELPLSKQKVKKLKGNVLIVPIVVIWLGLVFVGTLKLVTSILT